MWLNLDHLAGLMVRAQLQPLGLPRGADLLEARYEATGAFEVAVFFNDPKSQGSAEQGGASLGASLGGLPHTPHLLPIRVVATREEGEAFIRNLLGPVLQTESCGGRLWETQPNGAQSPETAELVGA